MKAVSKAPENEVINAKNNSCQRKNNMSGQFQPCNEIKDIVGQNTTSLLATVLTKQHVSAYSKSVIRFTNVSYRGLIKMRGMWQMSRSHHLCLTKYI